MNGEYVDYVIRYVPEYGYLGIVLVDGNEVYRTGKYYSDMTEVLAILKLILPKDRITGVDYV